MKTKIVYVVVSDETDIFLEQALLSVFSLRKHNPDAFVELVVDQATSNLMTGKRSEIRKYVTKTTVIEVPANYGGKGSKSRWIKTNLRDLIEGDYLFIDSDTIITDTLEEIDDFDADLGAVLDKHAPVRQNKDKDKLLLWSGQDGWTYDDNLAYFNSGVMYVRDSEFAHQFYREWHKRWQTSSTEYSRIFDQSPLAATNEFYKYPIKELCGAWNCQPTSGLSYLHKAKVMHYWGYNRKEYAWKFYDRNIIKEIKQLGYIPKNTADLVDVAKEAFAMPNEVIAGLELQVYYSPVFEACVSDARAFAFLRYVSKILLKLLRILAHLR